MEEYVAVFFFLSLSLLCVLGPGTLTRASWPLSMYCWRLARPSERSAVHPRPQAWTCTQKKGAFHNQQVTPQCSAAQHSNSTVLNIAPHR